jgi:hypothetical protein
MIRRWLSGGALAVVLVMTSSASAQGTQELFIIQRSTNRNEIHYDAQLGADGKLKAEQAVVAYWVRREEGDRLKELNWLARQAYGFTIRREPGLDSFQMHMASFKARAIRVFVKDGKARAEAVIDGAPAYLRKIYIDVKEGLFPAPNYIELFGEDTKTGQPRREKIVAR